MPKLKLSDTSSLCNNSLKYCDQLNFMMLMLNFLGIKMRLDSPVFVPQWGHLHCCSSKCTLVKNMKIKYEKQ